MQYASLQPFRTTPRVQSEMKSAENWYFTNVLYFLPNVDRSHTSSSPEIQQSSEIHHIRQRMPTALINFFCDQPENLWRLPPK